MTDAYYRTALDNQMKARSDYYAKRASLEQFVGNETFAQFEKDLKESEKSVTVATQQNIFSNEVSYMVYSLFTIHFSLIINHV